MGDAAFSAVLIALGPQVVSEREKLIGADEDEASRLFFGSQVYELLEDEGTALWHLSPRSLAEMIKGEIETGSIAFPEEV